MIRLINKVDWDINFRSFMKVIICTFITVNLFVFSAGCATITRGKTQPLTVNSDPTGANIELSNGMTGTTPWTFELPRKHGFTATISKDGYETVVVNVVSTTSEDGGMHTAGNILFGGLIGLAVDGGSGAMKDLTPNPVYVKLVANKDDIDEQNSSVPKKLEPIPERRLRTRLRELRSLLEEGDITQEEYDQLKSKILSDELEFRLEMQHQR